MQHLAYLSRPTIEVGASLVIVGNRLATGDILDVVLSNKERVTVHVAAFGLARLVLQVSEDRFECTPWKAVDDPLAEDIGVSSRWTVAKLIRPS